MQNANDPYTHAPASGAPSTSLSGVVMRHLASGTTVTAYAVQSDGSNGELLGTSATTGTDGRFSVQLTKAPSGMVRLLASGGTFISEVDGTRQAYQSLELVTPYVTTDFNTFVITSLTHIASHVLSYNASQRGFTLATAYTAGVGTAFELSDVNPILRDDQKAGIDYLKTVPGTPADALNTRDVLNALEWFAVRYDLPSSEVLRVVSAAAEADFRADAVDGAGAPVNAGAWVNRVFDPTAPVSLDTLMAWKNADGTNTLSPTGKPVHDMLQSTMSVDLINYFYRNAACQDDAAKPAFFARYPGSSGFFNLPGHTVGCAASLKSVADLKALALTNNRTKYMQ